MFCAARHRLSANPALVHTYRHHSRTPVARLFTSSLSNLSRSPNPHPVLADSPASVLPSPTSDAPSSSTSLATSSIPSSSTTPSPDAAPVAGPTPPPPQPKKPARVAPKIRATKAAMTLTPAAVERLRILVSGPTPQLIRVGVRNKGCAGMAYDLQYVEKPGRFDEIVEQDGVRVLIDSKALFSIIGSQMDWKEDRMSAKFVFKNPNILDACGCGESFNVALETP